MKLALSFTTVRFMPFAETTEFANVGVLVCAPQIGYVDFKLAPAKFKRVSDFFDDLDGQLYAQAIATFEEELKYVKKYGSELTGESLANFIREITRTREGIMTFGEGGVLLTNNPKAELINLFDRFIGRTFAESKEYREKQMVKALRQELTTALTSVKYKEQSLDIGFGSFRLPLVAKFANTVKAIKPLAFDQQSPLLLADHGDRWISRVKHLLNGNALKKEDFLFTIEAPRSNKREFKAAFDIVEKGMLELGVNVVPFEQRKNILEFAEFDISKTVDDYALQ
ncbi:DUF3037 domain-containing protein [Vibrio coralliilyticus]|uniref:DUF3037 domain-containing protein n=1 Tax=Vibrio coralliilyticus TaxID=190893 RepID=A0AAP6ZSY2_9VIBR|nr:DUF3037 domain-containing protein [Vibrio coralliilyticus]NOJ26211.1 DUF3037 domain-containing protein [Vibrio coralliilyticus]